jgi:uncharacterized membrane protein YciS (DUF1049 family)
LLSSLSSVNTRAHRSTALCVRGSLSPSKMMTSLAHSLTTYTPSLSLPTLLFSLSISLSSTTKPKQQFLKHYLCKGSHHEIDTLVSTLFAGTFALSSGLLLLVLYEILGVVEEGFLRMHWRGPRTT